ncbi:Cysteine-rich repeat secretory protein 4 [Nymphaea thermarum]|nr:Cysteine-rich repeat secretory protein 4 [Nymphaea thermarum]
MKQEAAAAGVVSSFFSFSFTVDDQPHQWQRPMPFVSFNPSSCCAATFSSVGVPEQSKYVLSVEDKLRESIIYSSCFTSDGFSLTYGQNLEQLFRSLVDSFPSGGLDNTSIGEAPNTTYGLRLFRGDASANICPNCAAIAAETIKAKCPNSWSAMIWHSSCLLRFPDTRSFGTIGGSEKAGRDFVDALARDAASNPKMYATRVQPQGNYTSYGMARCTRDLTPVDCMVCLQNAAKDIEKNQSLVQEFRFLSMSCLIGYDTRIFFLTLPEPASSSSPPPLPAPSSPSSPAVVKTQRSRTTASSVLLSLTLTEGVAITPTSMKLGDNELFVRDPWEALHN